MKPEALAPLDLKLALDRLAAAEKIVLEGLDTANPLAGDFARGLAIARSALVRLGERTAGGPAEVQRIPPRSMDPMKIALRVLTGYVEKSAPDARDLEALIRICGLKPDGMAWDEFACEALQRVLKDRAAARQSMAIGSSAPR